MQSGLNTYLLKAKITSVLKVRTMQPIAKHLIRSYCSVSLQCSISDQSALVADTFIDRNPVQGLFPKATQHIEFRNDLRMPVCKDKKNKNNDMKLERD